MSKGFTLAGVIGRLREIEKSASWTYAELCTLAVVRGVKRSTLEAQVFGQGKPSAAFAAAWTVAQKFTKSYFGNVHRTALDGLALDAALDYVAGQFKAHREALGNGDMSYTEYRGKCDAPDAESLPPPATDANVEGLEAPAATDAAPAATDAATETVQRDMVAEAVTIVRLMGAAEHARLMVALFDAMGADGFNAALSAMATEHAERKAAEDARLAAERDAAAERKAADEAERKADMAERKAAKEAKNAAEKERILAAKQAKQAERIAA